MFFQESKFLNDLSDGLVLPAAMVDFTDATEAAVQRTSVAGKVANEMFREAASVNVLLEVEGAEVNAWKSIDIFQRRRRVHGDGAVVFAGDARYIRSIFPFTQPFHELAQGTLSLANDDIVDVGFLQCLFRQQSRVPAAPHDGSVAILADFF